MRDPDPSWPPGTDIPRPAPVTRFTDRLRPWIDWFGPGKLIGTAVTVVLVVAGGWWLLHTPAPPTEAGLPYATTTTGPDDPTSTSSAVGAGAREATTTSGPAVLVVHVAGAVAAPGVYDVPGGSRVTVAVAAAGGPAPDADASALNLAQPLVDGERVYVPRVGESVPVGPDPPPGAGTTSPVGPIDLNRATAAELDDLPGIGPATAQAIVDHRSTNGPFASVDDLEAVRGIGPAKLDAIRGLVAV
ncbi:MAG: helix-hairpin-helix domain-containing protein [Ilumatobacteraceae bacterium]